MPKNRPENLPPSDGDGPCVFRMAQIERAGIDRENRSFGLILATETPVRTYDVTRGEVLPEVIHLSGMDIPKQVPLLDNHRDGQAADVLGSIRGLEVSGERLIGRAFFASDPISVKTFNDYVDGHRTDFSVGARSLAVDYEGNTRHVRRSRLKEGSAVLFGADPHAKAMLALRAYLDPERVRSEVMYEKLRALLVKRGLKEDASDSDVLAFAQTQIERKDATDAEQKELGDILRGLKDQKPAEKPPEQKPESKPADADTIIRAERERVKGATDICRKHSGVVTETERDEWIIRGDSVDVISRTILGRLAPKDNPTNGSPLHISGGVSEREKFYSAASDALVRSCLAGQNLNPARAAELAKKANDVQAIQRSESLNQVFLKPAAGYEQFQYAGLSDLARAFLVAAGERVDGLPKAEIARRAMRMGNFCEVRRSDGPAYHTTGSFSNLMLDAANKTLQAAYQEATSTWERWVRRAPSTPDFKVINRIKFGAIPNPEEIPENGPYPQTTTVDAKESYYPTKKGQQFSVTWEAVVNDDLDALSRLPAMHGAAMRRRINADCYAVLTGNKAMADGSLLFSTAHANGANGTVSAAGIGAMFVSMATQTALGASAAILNIVPKFLIVPVALYDEAWLLMNSMADPAAGGTAAGNSNTKNMYGPGGPRGLEIISDAVLDAASSTIWYGAADPSQIPTVEITFLQGNEAPFLDREEGFDTDTIKSKVRQVYAAAPTEHRGLYRGGTTVS